MNLDPEDIVAPGAADARLSIEVTKRCNSSCIHCFAAAGENNHNEIDYDIIASIIYEGADAGYRHLHITGGEPLLYGDIFKALDCALDAGYASILLNSNGFLLEQENVPNIGKIP